MVSPQQGAVLYGKSIHCPSAILSMETVTTRPDLAAWSFFSIPLPPCPGRMIAMEGGLYTTLSAQLSLCFYLRHTLGFEVEENYQLFQCLNPCVYFPRRIWCLFGPFLERKLERPRLLQSTLRNEPWAGSLSVSAIIQESHATPGGAILIKLETTASLST